jgi:hypothetical protein
MRQDTDTAFMSRPCLENLTLCFLDGEFAYSFMAASGMVAPNAPMAATDPSLTVNTGSQKSGGTNNATDHMSVSSVPPVGKCSLSGTARLRTAVS